MHSGMTDHMRAVRSEAKSIVEPLLHDEPVRSRDEVYEIIHRYVCHLLAADESISTDVVREISRAGIDALAARYGLAAVSDLSRACSNPSSTSTRTILLFVALGGDLGISFPPDAARKLHTVSDVTDFVCERFGIEAATMNKSA